MNRQIDEILFVLQLAGYGSGPVAASRMASVNFFSFFQFLIKSYRNVCGLKLEVTCTVCWL